MIGVHRAKLSALIVVLLAALAAPLGPAAVSAAPADICPDVVFVSARGSGQPSEEGTESLAGSPETAAILEGLRAEVARSGRSVTSQTINLNYPALSVGSMAASIPAFLDRPTRARLDAVRTDIADYFDGEREAETGFSQAVGQITAQCDSIREPPRLVLVGYSQGALALHNYLVDTASQDQRATSTIMGAVLVADPARLPLSEVRNLSSEGTTPSTTAGLCEALGFLPPVGRPSCLEDYEPVADIPESLHEITTQLCADGDLVCDTTRILTTQPAASIPLAVADGLQTHTDCDAYCGEDARAAGREIGERLVDRGAGTTGSAEVPAETVGTVERTSNDYPELPGLRGMSEPVAGRDGRVYASAVWSCPSCELTFGRTYGVVGFDQDSGALERVLPLPYDARLRESTRKPGVDDAGNVWVPAQADDGSSGLVRFAADGSRTEVAEPAAIEAMNFDPLYDPANLVSLPNGGLWVMRGEVAYLLSSDGTAGDLVRPPGSDRFHWSPGVADNSTLWFTSYGHDGTWSLLSLAPDGTTTEREVPIPATRQCPERFSPTVMGILGSGGVVLHHGGAGWKAGCTQGSVYDPVARVFIDKNGLSASGYGVAGRDGRFWTAGWYCPENDARGGCDIARWDAASDVTTWGESWTAPDGRDSQWAPAATSNGSVWMTFDQKLIRWRWSPAATG
ncbi:cutinase family protein [Actinomycetospora aeridis]|uniref:Cutinase family protein n=1 Tax=Actinomycetospora aeridis TaxID=3129231 RepID=A0ABU8N9K9_9PSEU